MPRKFFSWSRRDEGGGESSMSGPILLSILSGIRYPVYVLKNKLVDCYKKNYFLQQKNVMTSSMISNHESMSSSTNSPPEKSSTASSMLKSTLRYATWLNIESGTVHLFAGLICAVFLIHDILVWIRIHGFIPLTNGSGFGSGSCYFPHWLTRRLQKTDLKKRFFCLLVWYRQSV